MSHPIIFRQPSCKIVASFSKFQEYFYLLVTKNYSSVVPKQQRFKDDQTIIIHRESIRSIIKLRSSPNTQIRSYEYKTHIPIWSSRASIYYFLFIKKDVISVCPVKILQICCFPGAQVFKSVNET